MAVRRGEVYFLDFNPSLGREQSGRRPAVVFSSDLLNDKRLVVLVVPGTSGNNITNDYPTNVRVPAGEANLPNETVFLTFQMRAVDHSRFTDPPVGRLSAATLGRLEQAAAVSLGMTTLVPAAQSSGRK
jgi:mRNA interferase MazF